MPPSTTTRQTPAGIHLDDGFSTKIAFSLDPDASFWERTVTPPGIDGGDAIDTSTMHNTVWRTRSPRALKTMTDCGCNAAYDPNVYNNLLSLINREGSVTIRFPDGSTLDFYGFLKSFAPGELSDGTFPMASIVIIPTNQNPTTGVEEAPVLTSVPGT